MFATWDLGIMMEHENLGLKATNIDVNRIVGDLLQRILDKNMTTKLTFTLDKLNNNQGLSEPLSKQFYYKKAQSIPFPGNFEQ